MALITKIVFGYLKVIFFTIYTIKSGMKTTQKLVNNLINENITLFIFPLKVSSLRQDG